MKLFLTFVFLIFLLGASAQRKRDSTNQWDNNIFMQLDDNNLTQKLTDADFAGNFDGLPYYILKINKYSFKARFLGKLRRIDSAAVHSMKSIFKNTVVKTIKLDRLFSKEVLIKIGDRQVWMPIQTSLLPDFLQYVKKDDEITLYCLFLNEHAFDVNSLNNLLISEYDKEYFPVIRLTKKKSPNYISAR
jgi:hypothetical protein